MFIDEPRKHCGKICGEQVQRRKNNFPIFGCSKHNTKKGTVIFPLLFKINQQPKNPNKIIMCEHKSVVKKKTTSFSITTKMKFKTQKFYVVIIRLNGRNQTYYFVSLSEKVNNSTILIAVCITLFTFG